MERKIKLLYAEDELTMRELYTRILSGKGFDVHAVEDVEMGWRLGIVIKKRDGILSCWTWICRK